MLLVILFMQKKIYKLKTLINYLVSNKLNCEICVIRRIVFEKKFTHKF